MKNNFLAGVTIAVLLLAPACEDDCIDCTPPPPSQYQDLSQKGHVLINLELAYNNRAISEYTKLLDATFTMFFSAGDFGSGSTPEQWGREDEVSANTNLLNPSYVDTDPSDGIQPRCVGVSLDVKWEDVVQWQEIDSPNVPGEKWYTTTLIYAFQFDIEGDWHLINNPGSRAQFTVRNIIAGTDQAPRWQLVEMRDLGSDVVARGASRSTEASSWGQIKALYH